MRLGDAGAPRGDGGMRRVGDTRLRTRACAASSSAVDRMKLAVVLKVGRSVSSS